MNIDVLFVAGAALIVVGWFARKKAKGGTVRQVMAIIMTFGVFIILSHTLIPFVMTLVTLPVSLGADVVTGIIFGVQGLIMYSQARRGSMAVFAPIYLTIGVFIVLLNLAVPYITSLSDWSTTVPISG